MSDRKLIMIFLLLLPHLILLSGPDAASAGISLLLYPAFCAAGTLMARKQKKQYGKALAYPLGTAALSLLLGMIFYLRWQHFPLFLNWESLPAMPAKRICGIAASLLSLLALSGTDKLLFLLIPEGKANGRISPAFREAGFAGLTAAVSVTLSSRCSPFFAFNDWVDPHTMFAVGKSILRGMIPYRDVYEQKGPLILLCHTLGSAISYDSLTGIWILEILSCFAFLYFTLRIMKLRFGSRALMLLPWTAVIVFTALSFEQGDSAEEFCLPLITFALYVGIRSIVQKELPSRKAWIRVGITSGMMLWIKFSMLGFYLGWIIGMFVYACSLKRSGEVLRGIGWIAVGVGITSAPILLWFLAAGALPDLFTVYFYQNIILYPRTADMYGNLVVFQNLLNGLLNFGVFSTVIFLMGIIGLIWLSRQQELHVYHLALYSMLGMYLVIYFSGRFYSYYSLIFGAYAVFGLAALLALVLRRSKAGQEDSSSGPTVAAIMLCVSVPGLFLCGGNMRSLSLEKEDYPQYQAKAVIEASGIQYPTLMNYQYLDMGVDTIAGIQPNQRFFCSFNLRLPDIAVEQNACLDSGCVDFVLTFMLRINHPNYELAGEFPSLYNIAGIVPTYKLYQRITPSD